MTPHKFDLIRIHIKGLGEGEDIEAMLDLLDNIEQGQADLITAASRLADLFEREAIPHSVNGLAAMACARAAIRAARGAA